MAGKKFLLEVELRTTKYTKTLVAMETIRTMLEEKLPAKIRDRALNLLSALDDERFDHEFWFVQNDLFETVKTTIEKLCREGGHLAILDEVNA